MFWIEKCWFEHTILWDEPSSFYFSQLSLQLQKFPKEHTMKIPVCINQQQQTKQFVSIGSAPQFPQKSHKIFHENISSFNDGIKTLSFQATIVPYLLLIALIFILGISLLLLFGHGTNTSMSHHLIKQHQNKDMNNNIKIQIDIQKIEKENQEQERKEEFQIKNQKSQWNIIKAISEKLDKQKGQSKNAKIQGNKQQDKPISASSQQKDSIEKYLSQQLKELVKQSRFYDIHHFIQDKSMTESEKVIIKAKKRSAEQISQLRPLLKIESSIPDIQKTINKMTHPQDRPQVITYWGFASHTPEQIDTGYFFYELSKQPNNQAYLQAEYYRYDKLYNIGSYDKQLPLCVVMVGRNNMDRIQRTYSAIGRQNYTNYRIVHIDDHSTDGTIDKVKQFLKDKPDLRDRANLIFQPYKRNSLYNRNLANTKFCEDGDIIVDIDSDDVILGKQVFQLVNSLYQAGNVYKGKREELWCAYFSHIIKHDDVCCPIAWLVGQIDPQVLEKQLYRSQGTWRTTELRTYLWKIYDKVDKSEFVDKLMVKQGQFFIGGSDAFMQNAIVQMSNPKHMKVLDEFNYQYFPSPSKANFPEVYYSMQTAQSLPPYNRLESLDVQPTRNYSFKVKQEKLDELQKRTKEVIQKRKQLKRIISEMFERDKKAYISKQMKQKTA